MYEIEQYTVASLNKIWCGFYAISTSSLIILAEKPEIFFESISFIWIFFWVLFFGQQWKKTRYAEACLAKYVAEGLASFDEHVRTGKEIIASNEVSLLRAGSELGHSTYIAIILGQINRGESWNTKFFTYDMTIIIHGGSLFSHLYEWWQHRKRNRNR